MRETERERVRKSERERERGHGRERGRESERLKEGMNSILVTCIPRSLFENKYSNSAFYEAISGHRFIFYTNYVHGQT